MSSDYIKLDSSFLDYKPVSYGDIKGLFRGTAKHTSLAPGEYGVFLGAGQTFGRFVDKCFVDILSERQGWPVVNLGIGGVGPSNFRNPKILELVNRAKWCVVQVMSGRSAPNVLFNSFTGQNVYGLTKGEMGPAAFAQHVIEHVLNEGNPENSERLLNEMRRAWRNDMYWLTRGIKVPKILHYISDRDIDYTASFDSVMGMGNRFPQFIDLATFQSILPHFDAFAEVVSDRGRPHSVVRDGVSISLDMGNGTTTLVNRYYPSPEMHVDAADTLEKVIPATISRRTQTAVKPYALTATMPVYRPKPTPESIKPNFLVIGAAKSGTSTLLSQLAQHPDVFVPTRKELHFFEGPAREHLDEDYPEWNEYLDYFRGAEKFRMRGEGTVAYTMSPTVSNVAERIYEHLGPVKLIYIVRDPLERLISEFRHGVRDGRDYGDFNTWIRLQETGRKSIMRTDYGYQIKLFESVFPKKSILVEFYEDFVADRTASLGRVFNFLGVSDNHTKFIVDEVVNKTGERIPFPEVMPDTLKYIQSILRTNTRRFLTRHGKSATFWPSMV